MRVLLLLLLVLAKAASAQEVTALTWPTKFAAEPVDLGPTLNPLLPGFRMAVDTLPELTIVRMALAQPDLLGISAEDAGKMMEPVTVKYAAIQADPAFKKIPSALGYCFSATKPAHGLATLYLPKSIGQDTRAIVFMHGLGGSFQWYLHTFAELFPDALILAPAHGILPYRMPAQYLFEAIQAAEAKIGRKLQKPILVGLSAGVPPCVEIFARYGERFTSLIVITGVPGSSLHFSSRKPVLLMAGAEEEYVKDGLLSNFANELRKAGVPFKMELIPGGDHFFLLTRPGITYPILENWVKEGR